ncbi:MAG: hypothetical protein JSW26_11550 [Desulfobacterales bacterium]|nr:MAG: hypothetical protein JSW26_11550 [Desulfobacterales bacterium]
MSNRKRLTNMYIKIFIVNEDDTVEQLPVERYERLLRRDPDEKISKYAGKRIRYASVVVNWSDKKQKEIIHSQFSYLTFDLDGRLDVAARGKKASLALSMLPPVYPETHAHMIDARQEFARKRYDDQYKWRPSPVIIANIEKAIFGD